VVKWGPLDSDACVFATAGLFLAPIAILAGIVLLRGRMTEAEREIYHDAPAHPSPPGPSHVR
jgi:hypothetical protein